MRNRSIIITLLVVLLFTLFAVSSISFAFSEVKNQITLSISDFDKSLLQWTKLDFAIGYNLYRSEVAGVYDATPLNEFPITKRSFSDRNTALDKTYYYVVRPIMIDESLGNVSNEIGIRLNSDVKKTIYLQIKNPKVIVNGISKNIDDAGTEPIILNGRTLTPIRTVVEEVGGILLWDAVSKKMTVTYGGKRIEMWIGKTAFVVNGVSKEMSVAPQLVKGKTFIPIRYITDNLDLAMEWNNETKVITISTVSDMSVASSTPTPAVTVAPVPEVTVTPAPAVTEAPAPVVTAAPVPVVTAAPVPAVTAAQIPATTVAPPPATTVVPQPTVAKANITEGVYNIVNKATGGFMNAYSQIATKAPWMLVADKADGSQEQNFNVIRQSDGSYMFVCMNQSYGAGAKITDSSNHLNVGAQFNVANASYPSVQSYHIYDRGNGAYSISLSHSGNPDIAIGLSSTMPYNSPLLELKNYAGAGEQWELRPLSVAAAPSNPISTGAYPIKHVIQQWSTFNNPSYVSSVWGKYDPISYQACGVAAASMALSSLGINKSPIEICDLNVAAGNGNDGSAMACWDKLAPNHVKFVSVGSTNDIDTALTNYKNNPSKYSPPIMYLTPLHFVVITGETSTHYLTYDPGFPEDNRLLRKPTNYSEVHQFSK